MIDSLKSHRGYYLSFGVLMFLCVTLILKTANDTDIRMAILFLTGFLYAFWGIVHHLVHHDVSVKIVLEYVLVGALGIVLVLLLSGF